MRRDLDKYYTPKKLVESLLNIHTSIKLAKTILEPCVGTGNLYYPLQELFSGNIICNDIENDIDIPECDQKDATVPLVWKEWVQKQNIDFTITNPPYNKANEIVPLAFEHSNVGIAMLLRLSWLEPVKNRGKWLKEHSKYLSNIIIFSQPRPSFTEDGRTDSVTTAWLIWNKYNSGQNTKIDFIYDWKN